jgi:hypothetical protein
MLLLVVLLAQVVPPSDDPPPITAWGDIAGFHKIWEDLNSACRKLRYDSPEGEATCLQRDVLGWQLGWLGWCVRNVGLEIKWEMCPRTGRPVN